MSGVIDRFFAEARRAIADGQLSISVGETDVLEIADSAESRGQFRKRFRELNDPDLQDAIRDYLGEVINRLELAAERTDIRVDLLDRAALAPSAAAVVAGVAALLASAGTLTPFLLAGGLVGLVSSASGRTWMKFGASRARQGIRQVRLLSGLLK